MKDKIHWTWKKILGTILGILGIGTLTSCYGMPEDGFYTYSCTVKGKINGTEQPIEGILVNVKDSEGYEYKDKTNSEGKISLSDIFEGKCTITFTDVDGAENGSFAEKTSNISLTYDLNETVTLENAQ